MEHARNRGARLSLPVTFLVRKTSSRSKHDWNRCRFRVPLTCPKYNIQYICTVASIRHDELLSHWRRLLWINYKFILWTYIWRFETWTCLIDQGLLLILKKSANTLIIPDSKKLKNTKTRTNWAQTWNINNVHKSQFICQLNWKKMTERAYFRVIK